jgi:dipeptidase
VKRKIFGILFACVLVVGLILVPALAGNSETPADEQECTCTNILVGKDATVDGSAISTYCCDGARYAKIVVWPEETYEPGTMMPIYYRPYPNNYAQYLEYLDKAVLKGYIPQVEKTYRYVGLEVWYDEQHVGGINEYGLTIGETTINARRELRNPNGLLSAYTNYKESSLMTLALMRAKTAREAIQVMGSLAEEYGYAGYGGTYGEHITVNDGNEVWAFEIFSAPVSADWTPGCGIPGAVWCAERIPDDEVGVSANRARIGEVDLDDTDYFMASPNIFSLAEEMGWWNPADPFVWYDAYAPSTSVNLREWEVLNLVAPSLHLDPTAVRLPFSVKPDEPLTVQDVMAIHRDYYQGTPYDVTEDPAFYVAGRKSPMASPFGPTDLHRLIGVSAPRSVATASSVFSFVSQVRADLPDPIKGCFWYGSGPAAATCYVPIYSGVTKLPESWSNTDLTKVNREHSWWAFDLADQLPLIKWQSAIVDIKGVRDPAETTFFAQQPDLESAIVDLYSSRSEVAAGELAMKLVTTYTNSCMNAVSDGYWELVDYLLFKYYSRVSSGAPQELPVIECPPVPVHPGQLVGVK